MLETFDGLKWDFSSIAQEVDPSSASSGSTNTLALQDAPAGPPLVLLFFYNEQINITETKEHDTSFV